ncbi:MAG: c-type cytochrome [Oceanicoccus sp.]
MNVYKNGLKAVFTAVAASVLLAGCDSGAMSARGFSFPIGDAEKGKTVFLESNCLSCHTIKGVEDPAIAKQMENPIKLGGGVSRTMTYAELLTSVINPSHKVAEGYDRDKILAKGESVMRNYNDTMTVTDLTNLVTFLETKYDLKPYERSEYKIYYP